MRQIIQSLSANNYVTDNSLSHPIQSLSANNYYYVTDNSFIGPAYFACEM